MRVTVVSVEPLWPAVHGGRLRTAKVAEALARAGHAVTVISPLSGETGAAPEGVTQVWFPHRALGRLAKVAAVLRPGSSLGRFWYPDRSSTGELVGRSNPDVVLVSHTYLVDRVPSMVPVVVDVANVEAARLAEQATQAGGLRGLVRRREAAKARRWESAVFARASACLTLSSEDSAVVAAAGGRALLCPNGTDTHEALRSPEQGPVVMVASYGYSPNRDAAVWLASSVWPLVHARKPTATLQLVGRSATALPLTVTDGVEIHADVEDVGVFYRAAAVVCCPVVNGGGRQLKVTEALSWGRSVVATPYSARACPDQAREAVTVAADPSAFADAIIDALDNVEGRWRRERSADVPGWDMTLVPLLALLDGPVRRTVHLVEPLGQGGFHQHSAGVLDVLTNGGARAVLHTASDAESPDRCGCVHWWRDLPGGLRQVVGAATYVARTLPHLRSVVSSGDVVHIQGPFRPVLVLATMAVARQRHARVVFSPHNSFLRRGGRVDRAMFHRILRRADVVVAYSDADVSALHGLGAHVVRAELVHRFPSPTPEQVATWEEHLGPSPRILFAGQVRADKNPGLFVAIAAGVPGASIGVVGAALDGEEELARAVQAHGVTIHRTAGYMPLDDLAAAVAAADVVVCPYRAASVSGVASLAHHVGTPVVASDVGGLKEAAEAVFPEGDVEAGVEAVQAVLQARHLPGRGQGPEVLTRYLDIYDNRTHHISEER